MGSRRVELALQVVVVAFFLTACESAGGDRLTTTTGSISPTSSAESPTTTSIEPASTLVTPTSSVPIILPDGAIAPVPSFGMPGWGVLLASEDGIFQVDGEGVFTPIARGQYALAQDDTTGGLVYQHKQPGEALSSAETIIWWVPAGADVSIPILVPGDGQFLQLHDVQQLDGEPVIFYSRWEGCCMDDLAQTLRRFGLESREVVVLGDIGGWESGAGPVTVGSGIIGLQWFAEAYHGFRFLDLQGAPIEVAANPYSPEGAFDCGPCPRGLALFDDGQRLAYLESVEEPNQTFFIPRLIVRDLLSGKELHRVAIGDGGGELDAFGDVVAINALDGGAASVLLLSFDPPQVSPVPIDGRVRIIRTGLQMSWSGRE